MLNLEEAGINQYRITTGPLASQDTIGNYGAFCIPISTRRILYIIASDGDEVEWEHVSVHVRYQNKKNKIIIMTPTWDEMCRVKDLFWGKDELVIQYHPMECDYINQHKHVLHLWKPKNKSIPKPPKELIGL